MGCRCQQTNQIISGHSGDVFCVKFSLYGSHDHAMDTRRPVVCSSSFDKTIRFWNFKTAKEFRVLDGHTNGVCGIAFSPFNNGRYLCSGSYDDTIRLWDVETSKTLHVFKGHKHTVCNRKNDNTSNRIGVIGGNGYTICSGSYDYTIRLWDVETAKELTVFTGHKNWIRSVKYSPYITDTICSGSEDNSIRLWDIRSKKETNIFKGHTHWVWAVEYSPFVSSDNNNADGTMTNPNIICSGSWDNTIRFWDIRKNKQLYLIKGNDNEDRGICSLKFLALRNEEKRNKNTDNHM
ncbi:WD-40 repeat protein [Reticulomyxa filosa]|uniref:WD-40 repeat protein n=1 Tax=Reticulomyxa filosa TaxID=46433 RepID=X6MYT6_RETFI|nr:WD-40 repeat protein [Reticulomyxa filosa]|eukprot:ETO18961.1 WD-40 repeat protein [Reticulomyxa filosa]